MKKQSKLSIYIALTLCLLHISIPSSASVIKEGDITIQVNRIEADRYETNIKGPIMTSQGAVTSILFERRERADTDSDRPRRAKHFSLTVQAQDEGQCEGNMLVGKGDLASIRLPLSLFVGVPQEPVNQAYACGSASEQTVEPGQELGFVIGVGNNRSATGLLDGATFQDLGRYYGKRVLLGKVQIESLNATDSEKRRTLRAESNIYLDFTGLRAELDDLIEIVAKTPFIKGGLMSLMPGKSGRQSFSVGIRHKNIAPESMRAVQKSLSNYDVRFYSANGADSAFLLKSESGENLSYKVEKDGITWSKPQDSYPLPLESAAESQLDFTIKTDVIDSGIKAQTLFADTLTVIISAAG